MSTCASNCHTLATEYGPGARVPCCMMHQAWTDYLLVAELINTAPLVRGS